MYGAGSELVAAPFLVIVLFLISHRPIIVAFAVVFPVSSQYLALHFTLN